MKKDIYIIIGTAYLEEDEMLVKTKYIKTSTSVSNTVFERKLFKGFEDAGTDVFFISAPSLGYFPTSIKKMKVQHFTSTDNFISAPYNAFIGYAPTSKKKSIIRKINKLISKFEHESEIHLILCEAHKPYLDVAKFFKNNKSVKDVTLLIPDLPEHNVRSKNIIYQCLKDSNVKSIYKITEQYVDNFVFFAKPMANKFNLVNKKYIVNEGISNGLVNEIEQFNNNDAVKHIVFLGKLDERNGVKLIFDVASKINNPNVCFDLYGIGGNDFDGIKNIDLCNNIKLHGFVRPSEVKKVLSNATILLSPRFSNQEYTRYSFPSKMFDYLEAFKPIITFKLDCYPDGFENTVFYPEAETSEALLKSINDILNSGQLSDDRIKSYKKMILKHDRKNVALSIIDLIKR